MVAVCFFEVFLDEISGLIFYGIFGFSVIHRTVERQITYFVYLSVHH